MSDSDYNLALYNTPSLSAAAHPESSTASRTLETAAGAFVGVLGQALGLGVKAASGGALGGNPLSDHFSDQARLIQMQMQYQAEMQRITMVSNISKSRHEARMAAVRNMKP